MTPFQIGAILVISFLGFFVWIIWMTKKANLQKGKPIKKMSIKQLKQMQ